MIQTRQKSLRTNANIPPKYTEPIQVNIDEDKANLLINGVAIKPIIQQKNIFLNKYLFHTTTNL